MHPNSLFLSIFLAFLMLELKPSNGEDSQLNLSRLMEIFRNQSLIIPRKTRLILNSLRLPCRTAMEDKFQKCLSQFEEDFQEALNNHASGGMADQLTHYDQRWIICCPIYRHHRCIERRLQLNSFYSLASCDNNDLTVGRDLLDTNDQRQISQGLCPTNEHIEYMLCDKERNRFFGRNALTTMVLFFGFITLVMAILFAGYIIWASQRSTGRFVRFELLQPTELEIFSAPRS